MPECRSRIRPISRGSNHRDRLCQKAPQVGGRGDAPTDSNSPSDARFVLVKAVRSGVVPPTPASATAANAASDRYGCTRSTVNYRRLSGPGSRSVAKSAVDIGVWRQRTERRRYCRWSLSRSCRSPTCPTVQLRDDRRSLWSALARRFEHAPVAQFGCIGALACWPGAVWSTPSAMILSGYSKSR